MSPGDPARGESGAGGIRAPAESGTAESATAQWYRHFGTVDAPGNSECYAEWSVGIADDPELLRRIDEWPHNKRQPLLMLAAARFLGARISPYPDFRAFLDAHWADVSRIVLSRATQTNEAGRCATLLPSLAQIAAAGGRPLALIEVGASAGLTLFPDRYGYEYDAGARVTRLAPAGAAPGSYPVLGCAVTGPVPLPAELPQVVWRAGIDLNPLDVRNPDDVAWLEALIWPEQDFRRETAAPGDRGRPGRPAAARGRGPQRPAPRPGRAGAVGRHAGGLPQRGHGLPRRGGPGPVPRPPWRGSPSNAAATGSPTRGTR